MNLDFYRVYWADYLHNKLNDSAYVMDLDEYADIGTHWFALYLNGNTKKSFVWSQTHSK